MTALEDKIRSKARSLETNPAGKWSGSTPGFEPWYDEIYQHLQNVLLPSLRQTGERMIQYYPVYLSWGNRVEQGQLIVHKGLFATGYLCLSDKSLYLVTLTSVTEKFPLQPIGATGYGMRFVGFLLGGSINRRMPFLEDRVRKIPYPTVFGAEITTDYSHSEALFIRTANETWQVYKHFNGMLEEMSVALNMGLAGEFAAI